MAYLALASLVWAFSFGLISTHLPPSEVPPAFTAAVRLLLGLALFLPFLRRGTSSTGVRLRLLALGAVQFGLVYVTYLASFATLRSHEVALLTVFTPLFVWMGGDWLERRFHARHLGAALLAAAGAAVVLMHRPWVSDTWTGVLLMQASNAAFAAGQLGYRAMKRRGEIESDTGATVWMLAGACALTIPWAWWRTGGVVPDLSLVQWGVIAYLGVVATGLGFYWWNAGAARVGVGVLAAANNAKIPLGVLVSLLVFSSGAAWLPAIGGLLVICAATWLAASRPAGAP
jgi:drug/metabolite transporter (DMT)-like permease